jgi:futalosine hydrolase
MKAADGDILVLAAVRPEVAVLMDRIDAVSVHSLGGRRVHLGSLDGMSLRVVVTGPGVFNTVQALTACIEAARPAMMLQVGCGGGFGQIGMNIGDLAVATSEIDVHLGIDTGIPAMPLMELPFPVLTSGSKTITSNFPLNIELARMASERLKEIYATQGIGVFSGPFITGSTVTGSDERADFLFSAYAPCIESMEGVGAAFLSHYYGLPLLEIRCVSNLVGKRELSAWDLPLACRRAGAAAADMITFFSKELYDHPFISGVFHLSQ